MKPLCYLKILETHYTLTQRYMRGPETSSVRSARRTVPWSYMHIHKYQ